MKKPRGREMKALMERLLPLVTDEMLKSFDGNRTEWERNVSDIEPGDSWVEFCPFVLTAEVDGWELADGDPICNWCFNTFTEKFPHDVEPQALLDRMLRSLNEGLIVTDEQCDEYMTGHIEGLAAKAGKDSDANLT
jgi:hypothetical protein